MNGKGILEELEGQGLDLGGPGGTPHKGLTVRADLVHDLADLRLETHIEHAISLVHDDVRDTAEVGGVVGEEVDEAAGRGDQHMDSLSQCLHLSALLTASVHGCRSEVHFPVLLLVRGHHHLLSCHINHQSQ